MHRHTYALADDTYSQTDVASQLRRHIHDVIMAGNGPSVLLTTEHVIPILIKNNILASTSCACNSMPEHAEVGWALRALDRKKLFKSYQQSVSAVSGAENKQGKRAASSSDATSSP